jgi:hypothetical protein
MLFTLGLVGALIWIGTPPSQASGAQQAEKQQPCSANFLQHSITVAGSEFRTYRDDQNFTACLEVRKDGHIEFQRADGDALEYSLGKGPDQNEPALPAGTNVTGGSLPEFIVSGYTGGAHCCTTLLLFELGAKPRLIAEFPLGNYGAIDFQKDPADGKYFLHAVDETFIYWNSCYACFAPPPVILGWQAHADGTGSFQIALDKMRTPDPTATVFEQEYLKPAREAFDPDAAFGVSDKDKYLVGAGLWSSMLNLIYTGHTSLAWKVVDETWPAQKTGKDKFLGDFCGQLSKSSYWPDLRSTLRELPKSCSEALTHLPKEGKKP